MAAVAAVAAAGMKTLAATTMVGVADNNQPRNGGRDGDGNGDNNNNGKDNDGSEDDGGSRGVPAQ